jgi:hypothetical protein
LEVINDDSDLVGKVLWDVFEAQADALGVGRDGIVDENVYDSLQALKSALLNAFKEAELIHNTKYFVSE